MNPKPTLQDSIRSWVLQEIDRLGPGAMLPTELEIAECFSASRITVHKVMAVLQHDGFIIRRKGQGTFVAGREKQIHTANGTSSNGTVLIAYPDWMSEDIFYKVGAAEKVATERRVKLINFKISRQTSYESLLEIARSTSDLCGMILIPPGAEMPREHFNFLDSLGLPIVLLVPVEPGGASEHLLCVCPNAFRIGYAGVEHAASMGHREIGWVTNEPWHFGSQLTLEGMKKAMADHGLKIRSLLRPRSHIRPGDDSMKSGYDFTAEVLDQGNPTVLIYDSFPGMLAGMRLLAERGKRVPEDVSIILNSEYGRFEEFLFPAITTISYDRAAMVARAFSMLLDHPEERTCTVNVSLTRRESVADRRT